MKEEVSLIVEGTADQLLLKKILSSEVAQGLTVRAAGGKTSAISMARSLLVSRRTPVAVLLDSDTLNEEVAMDEKRSFEEHLASIAAGSIHKVFLSIPEIESIFFNNKDIDFLSDLVGQVITKEDWILGASKPKKALQMILGAKDPIPLLMKRIDSRRVTILRESSPLQDIIVFLAPLISPGKMV